ncbi:hypothetical protein RJ639_034630, partial [Escallonia herrerae]
NWRSYNLVAPMKEGEEEEPSQSWKIKMLFDGETVFSYLSVYIARVSK